MSNARRVSRRNCFTRLNLQRLEGRVVPATFTVTNTLNSGAGSLRQAINDANGLAGADTIVFNASANGTITLASRLSITDAITITGNGVTNTIVSGGNVDMVFLTLPLASSLAMNFSGMTITNGKVGSGGGISNIDSVLTLNNCNVTGNSATGKGGGIYTYSGPVTLQNCLISGNSAGGDGGGIYTKTGSLTIQNSTISNNVVTGALNDGGGINIQGNATVTIQNSTISGNIANAEGGGIYFNNGGSLTMDNSTVSGNVAQNSDGGGIYAFGGFTGLIRNSTISGNSAPAFGTGGGICVRASAAMTLRNSTVAFNSAGAFGGGVGIVFGTLAIESTIIAKNSCSGSPDVYGTVATTTSLIGDITGSTPTGSPLTGDPLLDPLANNGGPTQTHTVNLGSPAINKGSNSSGASFDQRGSGFVRSNGPTDIGAVEFQVTHNFTVLNTNDSGPGSLRQAISNANLNPGADTITFDPTFFATAKTITLGGTEMAITDSLTITGPAIPVTINGNNASRIFNVNIPSLSLQPVNLSSLIMTQGNANSSGNLGGAIQNGDDMVTVSDCAFTNNTAQVGGAAVWTSGGGYVSAIRCTFTGNYSSFGGGAIGFAANGGSLALQSSTMSGNTCANGGAIYFRGPVGAFGCTVVNSTISSNVASGSGGAVYFAVFSGNANFSNSTIVNNSAVNPGGGIKVDSFSSGTININSSIVANNVNGNAPDISSAGTVNVNRSAISSASGFTATGANNVPYGTDLKLAPLADNGGSTQTVALLFGSPCINAGSNALALQYDQRGLPRTQFGTADIGAFESQTTSVTTWAGGDSVNPTSWESPLNWSNGVPGKSDEAKLAGSTALEIKAAESIGGLNIPSNWSGSLNIFAPLTLNQSSIVRAGAMNIQSGGAVSILGTLNFANLNAVTLGGIGTWTNSGSIVHTGAGNLNLAGNAVIETLAGALFDFQSTGGVSGIGGMVNRGTLRKSGSTGTTSITSNFNNIGGSINVQTGALSLPALLDLNQGILGGVGTMLGQVANLNGSVRPGNSPGKLTINGGYSQGGTGELQMELNGTAAGVTYDQLAVVGSVTLGGTLTTMFGYTPQVNDTFIIIDNDGTSDAVTGTFSGMPEGSTFPVGSNFAQISYKGGNGNDVQLKIVPTAPTTKITTVLINDGSIQRSSVTSLKVTFNQPPSMGTPSAAFQLKRQGDSAVVTLAAVTSGNDVTLTFTGGAVNGKSLADGRYTLTALASQINNFDGNGDGTPGDNYVLVGSPANGLFRLFGDADGNGAVNASDFNAFRLAYGTSGPSTFDFDNDSQVSAADFNQFRLRYGVMI